jgi:hypothetical protein
MNKTLKKNFELLVKELTKSNLACDMAIEKETGAIIIAFGEVSDSVYDIIHKKSTKIGLEEISGKNTKQTFEVCSDATIFGVKQPEYIYETIEFSDKAKELNKAFKKVFSSYKKEADKSTLKLIKSIEKDLKDILN